MLTACGWNQEPVAIVSCIRNGCNGTLVEVQGHLVEEHGIMYLRPGSPTETEPSNVLRRYSGARERDLSIILSRDGVEQINRSYYEWVGRPVTVVGRYRSGQTRNMLRRAHFTSFEPWSAEEEEVLRNSEAEIREELRAAAEAREAAEQERWSRRARVDACNRQISRRYGHLRGLHIQGPGSETTHGVHEGNPTVTKYVSVDQPGMRGWLQIRCTFSPDNDYSARLEVIDTAGRF